MNRTGIPARGDVISIQLDSAGKGEVGKRRPCLILTDEGYNKTGRAIIMPFSTSIRGGTEEVSHPNIDKLVEMDVLTQPCVLLVDCVRHINWRNRNPRFLGSLPLTQDGAYAEAIAKLCAFVGDELLDEQDG